ncbi:MAG TPA: hypothetical protein VGS79_05395 [Puia sp.]|nr:hypothetical protein [Puia sp.]
MKKWVIAAGSLVVVLIAGYFVAEGVVRKKVASAFAALPDSLQVKYASLHVDLLSGSVTMDSLHGRGIGIAHAAAHGIGFWHYLRSHELEVRSLVLRGCTIRQQGLSLEGNVTIDSLGGSVDSPQAGSFQANVDRLRYVIPDADEIVVARHLELDSRNRHFELDTLRIFPTMDAVAIGRKRGHQVDVVEATVEGLTAEGLDVMGLLRHRLTAEKIAIRQDHIHIFRDRRLPLVRGEKDMPVQSLKALPVTLRIGSVDIGPTFFSYEEYPAKGDQTGMLKIYRLKGRIAPLINHPLAGDPAYITMHTQASLMNSGSVDATTKMPLHAGDPYLVDGAFHDLDVTTLNDPAENLGKLHLESGLLNFLSFHFVMTTEKSTGKIVGEYHDLVVDKLKDNGKVAKLKSFALKKLIIPHDKDKSLPLKKRTGKVDYKRDPDRYFSYYLLHSLLVGVKSSFSLGFLLPG